MQRFETGNGLRGVFLLPEGEGKDEGSLNEHPHLNPLPSRERRKKRTDTQSKSDHSSNLCQGEGT